MFFSRSISMNNKARRSWFSCKPVSICASVLLNPSRFGKPVRLSK
jgi:hypothetical protein